jgi:hypothetical protein
MIHRIRQGFTLVEFLVMIAVITFLIGLLLFAVQKCAAQAARIKGSPNHRQPSFAARHDGGSRAELRYVKPYGGRDER